MRTHQNRKEHYEQNHTQSIFGGHGGFFCGRNRLPVAFTDAYAYAIADGNATANGCGNQYGDTN